MHRKFLFLALRPTGAVRAGGTADGMDRPRHRPSRDPAFPRRWHAEPVLQSERLYGRRQETDRHHGRRRHRDHLLWRPAKSSRWCAGPVSVMVAGHKSGDVYYTKRLAGAAERRGRGRTQLRRGHRVRHQRRYGGHTRGGQITAGAERFVAECGRDPAAGHLRGWRPAPGRGRRPVARGAAAGPTAATRVSARPNYAAVGADGKPMTYADAKDLSLHNTLDGHARRTAARAIHGQYKTGEMKEISARARVAGPPAVFAHRSEPDHVLPRGHLARSGPHLDDPHRWQRA